MTEGRSVTLHHGNALDVLRQLPDNSIDAVITDPPYGLAEHKRANVEKALLAWLTGDREHVPDGKGFMGSSWDAFVPPPAVWDECFRVLKPGGHLLAFCGSRTIDLMMMSIRLAGLTDDAAPEIRDSIAWLYGSGFPKSLDVGKAIDKAAGATREVLGVRVYPTQPNGRSNIGHGQQGYNVGATSGTAAGNVVTAPATAAAREWAGWGTAFKPAFEPIVVARRPLVGTVAGNVQAWGTGALNIDACRIDATDKAKFPVGYSKGLGNDTYSQDDYTRAMVATREDPNPGGRWPANVALDGSQADALDQQSGNGGSGTGIAKVSGGRKSGDGSWNCTDKGMHAPGRENVGVRDFGDSGGASRFFGTFREDDETPLPVMKYQAKAPAKERPSYVTEDGRKIAHSTVKPLTLIRWLVRLVTPPDGVVLDPFVGSGTTAEAAALEGFDAVVVEREAEYLPLILQRMERCGAELTTVEYGEVEPTTVPESEPPTPVVAELPIIAPPPARPGSLPWSKIEAGEVVVGQGGLDWTVAEILLAGGRAAVTVVRGSASKSFNVPAESTIRLADRAA